MTKKRIFGKRIAIPLVGAAILGAVALSTNFFPTGVWLLVTAVPALALALACLPSFFSERVRQSIARSENRALVSRGRWIAVVLCFVTVGGGWWLAFCQLGGSLITNLVGTEHTVELEGGFSTHSSRVVACHYHVHLNAVPGFVGHNLCVSPGFYRSSSRLVLVTLRGKVSRLGFKVSAYDR